MKIPQEFTFSVKGGRDKIVILNCDLLDVAAHVSYLLHNLYGRMLVREPMMAEAFKEIIIDSIGNPDGPCWGKEPLKPAETEIIFTTPKTPDNPT